MAAEFIKSVAPEGTVTARIVKDKDLLAEDWQGIYAVGRGSNARRQCCSSTLTLLAMIMLLFLLA